MFHGERGDNKGQGLPSLPGPPPRARGHAEPSIPSETHAAPSLQDIGANPALPQMELVASAHSLGAAGTATSVHPAVKSAGLSHPPGLPCICAVPGTVLTCHTHIISFNPQSAPRRRELLSSFAAGEQRIKGVKQLIHIIQLMKGSRVATSSPPPPRGRVPPIP